MSVVNTIDRITEWARDNICNKVKLRLPPEDEDYDFDGVYDHELINPAAFALYVPTKDKLPPGVTSPIPSLCVRFRQGEDDLVRGSGSIEIELCLSAWNPGIYGADVLRPIKVGSDTEHRRWRGPEADDHFERYGGGWRPLWNFVDVALREIESVTNLDGIEIDRSVPVKYGPMAEQEAIPDFYPFWFAWITFSVKYPIIRNVAPIENLL